MPLVRIDLGKGKPAEDVRSVGEAMQRAMVETIDVPARDHFQVITEHDSNHLISDANYLELRRTDDVVFVQVSLSAEKRRLVVWEGTAVVQGAAEGAVELTGR